MYLSKICSFSGHIVTFYIWFLILTLMCIFCNHSDVRTLILELCIRGNGPWKVCAPQVPHGKIMHPHLTPWEVCAPPSDPMGSLCTPTLKCTQGDLDEDMESLIMNHWTTIGWPHGKNVHPIWPHGKIVHPHLTPWEVCAPQSPLGCTNFPRSEVCS